MKTFALWTLVLLNAALVVAVAGRLFRGTPAIAQVGNGAQPNDDYLMIPGEINGGNNAIVYVVDERTHQLSSMSFDDSMKRLTIANPRDLQRDFDNQGQPAGGNQGRRR